MTMWLLLKLSVKKCHGCTEDYQHTEHLTRVGRWLFGDAITDEVLDD